MDERITQTDRHADDWERILALADHVIENDGNLEELQKRFRNFLSMSWDNGEYACPRMYKSVKVER